VLFLGLAGQSLAHALFRPAHRLEHQPAEAPRFLPHRIRLLRKSGRVAEANSATVDCSLNAPDWKRLCQEANATPAGRAAR
jgi:hypothetical protein